MPESAVRVIAGRAREDGVVLLVGGVFGEAESFRYAFARDSGEKNFVGCGGLARGVQDVARFVVAEHDGFSG